MTMEQSDEKHYEGIPIMASNMDGVGTFEMQIYLHNKISLLVW